MVSKKGFDLIVITALLLHPAVGLVKMAGRRWTNETTGVCNTLGQALQIGL
jgi:hypothetical protein